MISTQANRVAALWVAAAIALGAVGHARGALAEPRSLLEADPATTAAADSLAAHPTASDDLSASTAPPWVPDRPVAASRPWETALTLPGRIVTLPLSAVGIASKHTMIAIEDAAFIPKLLFVIAAIPQAGLTLTPASLGERTGFGVSVGLDVPGLKRHLSLQYDGSTQNYNRTRVGARYGPARLDYAYEWRPQDRFYGQGLGASLDDTTTFATQTQGVRLGLARQVERPDRWRLDLEGWAGPREQITRRGREEETPSIEDRFAEFQPFMNRRFEHLTYGARVGFDTRRGVPRWSRGYRLAVEVERFDKPVEWLALRTTSVPYTFTRRVYEAEGGLSFWRDPRTFRLAVRVVDQDPDAAGTLLPYDLAALGGGNGLAGFDPGRFHDVDAVVGKLSYLFPLMTRLEMDLHAEAGGVYGDVWDTETAGPLEVSYGIALRPRMDSAVLGAIGVDWSHESVRIRFSIGGVE